MWNKHNLTKTGGFVIYVFYNVTKVARKVGAKNP